MKRSDLKIISGGQTGVDRAALDAAMGLGIPCGGWCPKGRKAEDGCLDPKYPLKETDSADYSVRTEMNVRDSDGTLIITKGKPTGGTAFTIAMARVHGKPAFIIDVCHCEAESRSNPPIAWIKKHNIRILNIAGPRESNFPGIYEAASEILREILVELKK